MPRRIWLLIAVGAVVVIIDQWTKLLAVQAITHALESDSVLTNIGRFYAEVVHPCRSRLDCRPIPVIAGYFELRYVENPGAAWGLFARTDEGFRAPFFFMVSLAAMMFIVGYVLKLEETQRRVIFGLSLIFGGALGNFVDRLHLAYVIDFIDWHVGSLHWPTFNLADAAISSGVGLLLLDVLLTARTRAPEPAPPPEPS